MLDFKTKLPEIYKGNIYKHFKGGYYEIVGVARDCNDPDNLLVVYKSCKDGVLWSRSLAEFTSKVDRVKYPFAKQEYRFEYCSLETNIKNFNLSAYDVAKYVVTYYGNKGIYITNKQVNALLYILQVVSLNVCDVPLFKDLLKAYPWGMGVLQVHQLFSIYSSKVSVMDNRVDLLSGLLSTSIMSWVHPVLDMYANSSEEYICNLTKDWIYKNDDGSNFSFKDPMFIKANLDKLPYLKDICKNINKYNKGTN